MAGPQERLEALRQRRPFVDHVFRMVEHYGTVKGNLQAGAVTYFAFLSFFPVLALGFLVVGRLAVVFPNADDALSDALESMLPGIFGTDEGELSAETFQQDGTGLLAIVSVLGLLYAGLGWLSAMREALIVMFEMPAPEQPNFVLGKLRDLLSLVIIGVTLILSVAVAGFVSGFAADILGWLGLGEELAWALQLLSVALGFGANLLLFFILFKLLARPSTPTGSLWAGALLGGIGFELLKRLSFLLLEATQNSPAFQVFGIALILLVWIYYFSRIVMYAAAWAHTAAAARAQREHDALHADRSELQMRELAEVPLRETPAPKRSRVSPGAAFAAGSASTLGLVALARRRKG
ncbi:YihY/virulence factor BrkB family protein [Nocardioides sp. GXQ0305]|uniref:YihY/virulence factor BrkB family protein n=1 Tax=Nocardioides sp. GXQ0305 TaxID=3423912 RepID=UPI003D7D4D3B